MLKFVDFDIVFQEIPDETVLALNLSNCPNRCKGCHSPHLMEDIGVELTSQVLLMLLAKYRNAVTCVCFMGGDGQPREVERLAKYVRGLAPEMKIGWYSGKSEIPPEVDTSPFQYLKLGPYMERLGSLKSHTTNQRLYKVEGGRMVDITSCFW